MPCKAGVRREQSQSSSPAQLPAAVLGATRGGFGVPEAQMSGGPSTALGTAGSELVSSFPLWSALGLTAEAPAHPCLLLSFFSSKRSQKSSWIKVCYWPLHWGRGLVKFCSVQIIPVTSHTGGVMAQLHRRSPLGSWAKWLRETTEPHQF